MGDRETDRIPYLVTDPEQIPSKRYYDEQFFRLECERLWPRVWQMACRLEQIPDVGDFMEYDNLDISVLIVRTQDGVSAYQTACRRWCVKLAEGHGNCEAQGFACPFHGWRCNVDCENTIVYRRGKFSDWQLDAAAVAVGRVRVELWVGCVFINFDENAPSLRDEMGCLTERLERYRVHEMRADQCYATVLPANWKLAMESFMEGYSVMRPHSQQYVANAGVFSAINVAEPEAILPPMDSRAHAEENTAVLIHQLGPIAHGIAGHSTDRAIAQTLGDLDLREEVTRQVRARGDPTPDFKLGGMEFIFPHVIVLPSRGGFSAYRIRPLGTESCVFELWSLSLHPEGQEPAPVMDPVVLPYDSKDFPEILQQDYARIARQQLRLHAPDIASRPLSAGMENSINNYQRIIDGYLLDVAPSWFAKAGI